MNGKKIFPISKLMAKQFKARDIATAIQGFHLHLQGLNPIYTTHMFNYILNLLPSAILLGSNSRLFAGKLFSLYEPRIYLYDHSEQQNSGFPAIPKYLDRIEDYIDYIASRPGPNTTNDYFGLEKDRHDDLRIRLNSPYYRVETRIMSVQPTPKGNCGNDRVFYWIPISFHFGGKTITTLILYTRRKVSSDPYRIQF